jgi:hypothetical protein
VTDDDNWQAAETASQALVASHKQAVAALLRTARPVINSFPEVDRPQLAEQIRLAMDIDPLVEVAQLFLARSRQGRDTSSSPSAGPEYRSTAIEEVATSSDIDSVRPENLKRLLTEASKEGIAKLSAGQVFLLAVAWILLIGVPVIQQALPPEDQAVANTEVGTVGLALAITTLIIQKRK